MKYLKNKKFFTYLVVGALVLALILSCKSKTSPFGGFYVPTASGVPATDLPFDSFFLGNINKVSLQVVGMSQADVAGNFTDSKEFWLELQRNKIGDNCDPEALINARVFKSGNEYSASGEFNQDGVNNKEYIRFTLSTDRQTVNILEYIGAAVQGEKGYKFVYRGSIGWYSTFFYLQEMKGTYKTSENPEETEKTFEITDDGKIKLGSSFEKQIPDWAENDRFQVWGWGDKDPMDDFEYEFDIRVTNGNQFICQLKKTDWEDFSIQKYTYLRQ